jgi:hypothetical protein
MMAYTVLVDENGHYRDESARYEHGQFASYDDAVAACQQIVDEFLAVQYQPGQSADALFTLYTLFGADPFIRADGPEPAPRPIFSAWEYARLRCTLLCTG